MSDSRTRSEVAELDRRVANMVRFATVIALDPARRRVKVEDGDWQSGWLPWLERRAHDEASWSPPKPAERVVVMSPHGDVDQAVVMTGLPCDDYPPPSAEPTQAMHRLADGAFLRHDAASGAMVLKLAAAGSLRIEVGDSVLEFDTDGLRISTSSAAINTNAIATVSDEVDVTSGSSKGRHAIVTGVGDDG